MYAGSAALLTAALAAAPAFAPAASVPTDHQARVVIVAVPDLRWADIETMPRLQDWARSAAAGELSVKTASGTPRCADGAVTFNAGERAVAPSVHGCTVPPATFRVVRAHARSGSFAADPGAFGHALHAAGLRTAAVGVGARALLADEDGHVDEITDLATALRSADVVAVMDESLYAASPAVRPVAASDLDAKLAVELAQFPADATVVVAGISDGESTGMHLHALMIRGPGWPHRALRSPSTRAPYVQLRDLAPTLLAQLNVAVPSVMGGAPAFASHKAVVSAASYADSDRHAVRALWDGRVLRIVFSYVAVLVLLLFVAGAWRPETMRAATAIASISVAAPAATFLLQIVPWWRWSPWLYGVAIAACGALVGVAIHFARRRSARLALSLGPVVTAAILIGDQLAGARLQISAPLGDSPIVAGRFHGMGNTDFALMCASVVILAACVAPVLERRRGLAAASALCLVAVVVDSAPTLGDDFGGLLTMVPTAALLIALLAGVRLTWRRVLTGAVGVAALAVLVALADYARPPADQTHVGRFVGQVLHGGAGHVIHRKLGSSLNSFDSPGFTGLVAAAVVLVAFDRRRVIATLQRINGLPQAALALILLAVLGTFLNDSGVVVGGSVVMLAVLAVGASGAKPVGTAEDHEEIVALAQRSSP
jgi:hypothetical protein